jgi:protein-disulfide isomerase/sulfite exporter TauE/SafE
VSNCFKGLGHIFISTSGGLPPTQLSAAPSLGSSFTLSAETGGLLIILASVVMIMLGLQMLNLFSSLKQFQPRMPKFLAHEVHEFSDRETKVGSLVLGASTFFLPCGFTQSLQLYVLAKGGVATGALTMLAFSLGTLPALMSLSAVSSFASGAFKRYFLRFAGAAVVMLGLFNIQSGLTLTATVVGTSGINAPTDEASSGTAAQSVPVVDGKQIVDMKIVGYRYAPNQFKVVQGIPVEWRIDAREAAGCGRILLAPKAGVRKLLPYGTTLINFTPQEPGEIRFNCGMGMMTRGSKITVVARTEGVGDATIPAKVATTVPESANAAPEVGSSFSLGQRRAIEQITRDYLLQNPEVIQEAFAALGSRQRAEEAKAHAQAVKDNAATIFSSPRQVVLGNPHGDVTLVEFFDYNCAYCRHALADMLDLLKNDDRLRVVLKEFPVLGDASVEAAQVAVGVRMQDPTGDKYLEFHQKLLGGRGRVDRARALAIAKEVGLDMDRLERDMTSPEVKATIDENLKLGEAVGITGTPTYVIGSEVVTGAVGLDVLREKIKATYRKSNG